MRCISGRSFGINALQYNNWKQNHSTTKNQFRVNLNKFPVCANELQLSLLGSQCQAMLSNSKIKFLRSLQSGKFRVLHGQFLIEGPKMVNELINSQFNITGIFATELWMTVNSKLIGAYQNRTTIISNKDLARISALKTPNEVVAIAEMPKWIISGTAFQDIILMLDGISDPGNLGTIIRIADWFGIKNIICSDDTVDVFNPKVVQATMGSIFRVKVYYTNLEHFFLEFGKNIPIYGAFLLGDDIYKEELSERGIIVIGSESHGISPTVEKFITKRLFIPSFSGGVESLNASVATAIVCSEFRRRFH